MTGTTTKVPSWKARRRGRIRCSPACGAGCTQAQYEHAKHQAQVLADLLTKTVGGKWRPRVWENLGWHWCARSGGWKVHPSGPQTNSVNGKGDNKVKNYIAFLGVTDTGGTWAKHGRTPRSAVINTRREAMAAVEAQAALLNMTLVPHD